MDRISRLGWFRVQSLLWQSSRTLCTFHETRDGILTAKFIVKYYGEYIQTLIVVLILLFRMYFSPKGLFIRSKRTQIVSIIWNCSKYQKNWSKILAAYENLAERFLKLSPDFKPSRELIKFSLSEYTWTFLICVACQVNTSWLSHIHVDIQSRGKTNIVSIKICAPKEKKQKKPALGPGISQTAWQPLPLVTSLC